jgi:Concanavalin A-like lectin/glucanases superfamily
MRMRNTSWVLAVSVFFAATSLVQASINVAGNLQVNLRADDPSASTATWVNTGMLPGSFTTTGAVSFNPNVMGTGLPGVELTGTNPYVGPLAPAALTGNSTRSIEVWEYNPTDQGREMIVAWGHRGGPNGTNLGFGHGGDPNFGAAVTWGGGGRDTGWSTVPTFGAWHYLVMTYDGATSIKLYRDGVLDQIFGLAGALNTHPGGINIGSQNIDATLGNLDGGERFIGYVGVVRIQDGVLSDTEVLENYQAGFSADVMAVPEPVSSLLLAVGGLAVLGRRRRTGC